MTKLSEVDELKLGVETAIYHKGDGLKWLRDWYHARYGRRVDGLEVPVAGDDVPVFRVHPAGAPGLLEGDEVPAEVRDRQLPVAGLPVSDVQQPAPDLLARNAGAGLPARDGAPSGVWPPGSERTDVHDARSGVSGGTRDPAAARAGVRQDYVQAVQERAAERRVADRERIEAMLEEAAAHMASLPREEQRKIIRAQRRSWAVGEFMLDHPEAPRSYAEAIVSHIIKD